MQLQQIPSNWRTETNIHGNIFVYDEHGVQRCGAKCRDGSACIQTILTPCGRCRMHRGHGKSGSAHPNYTHGKNSRFRKQLPARLQAIYDGYVSDAELDNLDPNIAILDTRITELIERLESGDYGATYQKLRSEFYKADVALRSKDMEDFARHWTSIRELIETGSKDYSLWQQIVDINDRRGKMVERKHNILSKSDMTLTINQFVQVLGRIERAFMEVADLPTAAQRRKAFSSRIQDILTPAAIVDNEE